MAECCGTDTKLIYSCSGAADVGEIADRVVRKLRRESLARMTCLAGIAAGLSGYVQSAKGADQNITVDGCAVACAKKALEKIGVTPTAYILSDLGLVKGESPVTEERIAEMCEKIKSSIKIQATLTSPGQGGCGCNDKC